MKKTEVKNLVLLSLLYGKTAKNCSAVNKAPQSNLTDYNRQSFELAASQTQAL
jgi:hypothetical protein